MNRRSLLRIFGLGGASAAVEGVAGPAWLGYGGVTQGVPMAGYSAQRAVGLISLEEARARNMADPHFRAIYEEAAGLADEFLLTDIGGAL